VVTLFSARLTDWPAIQAVQPIIFLLTIW